MPVNLPQKQLNDPRLLSFLFKIAGNAGKICLAEDEYASLEDEPFFNGAERLRLIRIDHGGEWTDGAVISITRAGRLLIGETAPESIWEKLEMMLRRRIGGADG